VACFGKLGIHGSGGPFKGTGACVVQTEGRRRLGLRGAAEEKAQEKEKPESLHGLNVETRFRLSMRRRMLA
jgi:hypothetical protein